MTVGIIYRPPTGNVDCFIKEFSNTLHNLIGNTTPSLKECFILGDLNIDYMKHDSSETKKLKDVEFVYNLRQIITSPTRQTQNSKSIIDHIFTTLSPDLITSSGADSHITISDHLPVYIVKKKPREYHPKKQIKIQKKGLYNPDYFRNFLLDDPGWQLYWCCTNTVNDMWRIIVEIITRCLNVLCPIRKIIIRQDQQDWFDGDLRTAIKNKTKLYKNACMSRKDVDWNLYVESRKYVRTLTIKKKRQYITTKLNETKCTPKKFWNEIQNNLSFGKIKARNTSLTIYAPNKTLLTGEAAANEMNTYYVNVGKKLAQKFNKNWDPITLNGLQRPPELCFRFIGEKETISFIKSLKMDKSTQIPDVPMLYLKDALLSIIPEMTYLLNECLRQCIMPYGWKIGHITPIPKTVASYYTINYRPISVLPAPSKIIERAVYNQIVYHLKPMEC